MTMPDGEYYVGDLCYVMHERWNEFCELTIQGNAVLNGEFTLKDGTKFATYCTKWGDGCYEDMQGRRYSVDAGLIGCIRVEDIKKDPQNDIKLGNVVKFNYEFNTSEYEGVIKFGEEVSIDTDPQYEDEYEYEDDPELQ